MYKLLTPEQRGSITALYRNRRSVVMLSLAVLLVTFSLMAVLPSYIFATTKKNIANTALNAAKTHSRVSEKSSLERWTTSVKQSLSALEPGKTGKPYDDFQAVISAKTSGIKIIGFSWDSRNETVTVKVRGVASDRQALLDFQSALQDSDTWREAQLPVDALAKDSQINFELTLTRN